MKKTGVCTVFLSVVMGAEFSSSVLAFVLVIFEPVLVMLLFFEERK